MDKILASHTIHGSDEVFFNYPTLLLSLQPAIVFTKGAIRKPIVALNVDKFLQPIHLVGQEIKHESFVLLWAEWQYVALHLQSWKLLGQDTLDRIHSKAVTKNREASDNPYRVRVQVSRLSFDVQYQIYHGSKVRCKTGPLLSKYTWSPFYWLSPCPRKLSNRGF